MLYNEDSVHEEIFVNLGNRFLKKDNVNVYIENGEIIFSDISERSHYDISWICDSKFKTMLSEVIAETFSSWHYDYHKENIFHIIMRKMFIKVSDILKYFDNHALNDSINSDFTDTDIETLRSDCGNILYRYELEEVKKNGDVTTVKHHNKHYTEECKYIGERKEEFDYIIEHWKKLRDFIDGINGDY